MSPRHQAVRDTADAQSGLITAAQLAEIGLAASTVSRRALGGMWTRVLPGVHLVNGGHPTRRQREVAGLLYAGDPTLITGLGALRQSGFRAMRLQETSDDEAERPEPVHLLIPHHRRRVSTGYVRVERTHRFPDSHVVAAGLSYAPLPRAIGDATRRLRVGADALAIVSEAVQRRLVTIAELELELDEGSRRGSAVFRDAVRAVSGGARSAPEGDLARLFDAAGIRGVLYNAVLLTPSGALIATPDAWLDDIGLAIEVDSREYHASPDGFANTLRRNARYAAAGVPVVGVLPTDLHTRPAGLLADIVGAMEAAARTPRPDVTVARHESPTSGRDGWRWGA
jgi:hypothetical protein